MKLFRYFAAFSACALCVAAIGCGGQKTPPDMPKLYPTSVTIVQEGEPVADAIVQFVKKDNLTYKWLIGGRTDAQGVCQLAVNGKYKGAPEGDFVVVAYKTTITESETRKTTPTPEDPAEAQAWAEKVAEEESQLDEIDLKYKKFDTTDLTISVVAGKNEATFDVGPKVSIESKPTLQR